MSELNKPFVLHYQTYEGNTKVESCPIVVIHGLLGTNKRWHEFCLSYSESTGRKVIAIDLRNHGESPRSNFMTYPLMAGDIAKTLKQLNISRAVIIGHSIGGKLAMEFALSMPDSVEKLIVEDISPMAAPAPLVPGILSGMINLNLTQINNTKDADAILKESIPYDGLRSYVLTCLHEDENGKFNWLVDVKNIVENVGAIVGNGAAIELNGRAPYTGDSLFIAGGESEDLKNVDMNEIRKIFPKADRKIISGASHFVLTDKPREFQEIVHKFLTR